MEEQQFCGEMERRSGRPDTSGRIGWILAAVPAAWAIRFAIAMLVGGCAHTSISRNDVECGNFSSSDTGVGIIHVPAGQYATYAMACGAERFSRVVAEHRTAMVRAAYAAASGGRDPVAREEIARTQRDVHALAGAVVQLGETVGAGGGGQ